jgi:dsRNA-specific ribonuclease
MTIPSPLPEPSTLPKLPAADKKYESQIITHKSAISITHPQCNKILATIGAQSLHLAILTHLFKAQCPRDSDTLSKTCNTFVSNANVTCWGRAYELDKHVNVAAGMLPLTEYDRNSIAKDAFYASIGAACLSEDTGQEGVTKFVGELISGNGEQVMKQFVTDEYDKSAMSKLHERLVAMGIPLPLYERVDEESDQRSGFRVKCIIEGDVAARADGRTVQEAKHRAAAKVLEKGDRWYISLRNNVKRESP